MIKQDNDFWILLQKIGIVIGIVAGLIGIYVNVFRYQKEKEKTHE